MGKDKSIIDVDYDYVFEAHVIRKDGEMLFLYENRWGVIKAHGQEEVISASNVRYLMFPENGHFINVMRFSNLQIDLKGNHEDPLDFEVIRHRFAALVDTKRFELANLEGYLAFPPYLGTDYGMIDYGFYIPKDEIYNLPVKLMAMYASNLR